MNKSEGMSDERKRHEEMKGEKVEVDFRHVPSGGVYAVKEIFLENLKFEDQVTHVKNEKAFLLEFKHLKLGKGGEFFSESDCIPELWGTMKDSQSLYLIMDMIPGAPLHHHLQARQRRGERALDPFLTSYVLQKVCGILNGIHRMGWVYRDLKLSNVMLHKAGERLALVDFGLSKKLPTEGREEGTIPRTRSICGTLHALAPEVFSLRDQRAAGEEEEGYTSAIDVWALGILAFELLAGKPPFGYQDPAQAAWEGETARKIKGFQDSDLERIWAEAGLPSPAGAEPVDEEWRLLRNFVFRVLKRSPADRPLLPELLQDPLIARDLPFPDGVDPLGESEVEEEEESEDSPVCYGGGEDPFADF